jgi:hypothetical protein
MSKRTIVLQSAGSLLGLACLNLALAPTASAVPSTNMSHASGACAGVCTTNMSNGTGGNMSNGTGGNMSNGGGACQKQGDCNYPGNMSNGTGGNMSNGTGGNVSNGTGGECKTSPCPPGTKDPKDPTGPNKDPGKDPKDPGRFYTDREAQERAGYVIGLGDSKAPGFKGALGSGVSNYGASSAGLSKQMMELLNAASNAYAEASARLAAIQSQAAPSAQKDTSVRYSRVADANADCGCNASAAAPDNSVELAAAKKAEAEAAASLAKAQQQAREFLEAQKKSNLANGTQFTPIW